MTTKDAVQSPTNSLFPSAERPFFYTDPSSDGSCFFSTEAERDAAMAEAIAAWCDEGWSEEVEQIFAGVVSHTVEQCDVQKKPQPCAAHPDHDYGDNDCEACIAWDEFPNHEFDEVCNYKPVALAPTAEQAEGVRAMQHWNPVHNTDPVQRACGELPVGWEIEIILENGAGCVYLIDPMGKRTDFDNADKFDWTIHDAIDAALAASSAGDQA